MNLEKSLRFTVSYELNDKFHLTAMDVAEFARTISPWEYGKNGSKFYLQLSFPLHFHDGEKQTTLKTDDNHVQPSLRVTAVDTLHYSG